jgi:hypothetical protein
MTPIQIQVNPQHPHGGMPGWEATGLDLETMLLIRSVVMANHFDSPRYQARRGSGVFIQGYQEPTDREGGWILLEFWQPDYQRFVDHLNAELRNPEAYRFIREVYAHRFAN